MTVREQFGANLRHARKRSGLSQEDLATRASLHRTHIGLLERGERLARVDTAVKLAGALEIDAASLLAGIAWEPGKTQLGPVQAPRLATLWAMAKRSKKPADLNRLASAIVDEATDEDAGRETAQARAGRSGGVKGGKRRAESLSAERRSEIARAAAEARWNRP